MAGPAVFASIGCASEVPSNVSPTQRPMAGRQQDVVLVVIDTLRADAVPRSLTPTFDRLSTEGTSIPYAWAPSTWTAPSTLSLMVGAHVREHGWDMPFPRHMRAAGESYPTLDDYPTLAEVMRSQGYETHGVYGNPLLSRELGWERGFDSWNGLPDVRMPRFVRGLVQDLDADEPLFLSVHFIGPHQPLKPSQEARARWGVKRSTVAITKKGIRIEHLTGPKKAQLEEQYVRAYYAEVEDCDARLDAVLSALGPRERDALVIVTSDHGELLGEHELWGHDYSVWNPLTHVPLVVWGGQHPPLPETLSTAAIPDIVTRTLGIPATWPLSIDDPPVLVSQREGNLAVSGDGVLRGVWAPGEAGFVGSYDLATDPSESQAIGDFGSKSILQMHRARWEVVTPLGKRETLDHGLDDETQKLLEELGYMGSAPPDVGDNSLDTAPP
jgi:hypothetical protein